MSITKLNDEDLLDYLMNSEYTDDLSTEEYKFLLKKWKFFYRLQHSKNNMLNNELKSLANRKEKMESSLNYKISEVKKDLNKNKELIKNIKNKKLSFSERISGKIKIIENNENK